MKFKTFFLSIIIFLPLVFLQGCVTDSMRMVQLASNGVSVALPIFKSRGDTSVSQSDNAAEKLRNMWAIHISATNNDDLFSRVVADEVGKGLRGNDPKREPADGYLVVSATAGGKNQKGNAFLMITEPNGEEVLSVELYHSEYNANRVGALLLNAIRKKVKM